MWPDIKVCTRPLTQCSYIGCGVTAAANHRPGPASANVIRVTL
jgi:hypothetical protein